MYVVFKAYGKTNNVTYYGYSVWHDVKAGLLSGVRYNRKDETPRGVDKFFELNGGNPDNIMVEELAVFDSEEDAWSARNDYRAGDINSITGPTVFPPRIAQKVKASHPERFADWYIAIDQREAKTARQAWAAGRWTQDAVKGLIGTFKKEDVVRDLDKCAPDAFAAKYAL